jgi:ankyrin
MVRRRWRPGCAVITGARRGCERSRQGPLDSVTFCILLWETRDLRVFLNHGAKANAEDDEGGTPLSLVSRGEYPSQADGVRLAQLLLDRGADVNGQPKVHWTPLHWASYRGKFDIVRLLIDHGASTKATNKFLGTPLHAVSAGEYESRGDGARVTQLLLERGADVTAQDIHGETPLYLAACFGKVELARVLLDHGAVATEETYDSKTPLHGISRGKSDSQPEDAIRLVQLLVERGADVNAPDRNHDTPLHSACYVGKLDIARELLNLGATVTTKNGQGGTPLHVTSRGEYESQDGVRLARLLLEHGADVNAQDMENDTPLHFACRHGKLEIARLLLDRGAAADAKNKLGETPLHIFSTDDSIFIARLLLERGVDVDIHDKQHRTPLSAASFCGNLEIARVLLDHGAMANAKDDYGWTPLHLTSQYRSHPEERGLDVARLLLERGADAHVPDLNHVTPLDSAYRRGWSKMVQVLLEHGTIYVFHLHERVLIQHQCTETKAKLA